MVDDHDTKLPAATRLRKSRININICSFELKRNKSNYFSKLLRFYASDGTIEQIQFARAGAIARDSGQGLACT